MSTKDTFEALLKTLEREIRNDVDADFLGKATFERFLGELPLTDEEYFTIAWFACDLIDQRGATPKFTSGSVLQPTPSQPGTITVDSRGLGEIVAVHLEEAGFKAQRVYPRGCSGQEK